MEKWIKVKILDKNKKSGWFWDSYKIVVHLVEEGVTHLETKTMEIPCNIDNYYNMEVGKEYNIMVYQHANGLWYPFKEMS